MHKPMPLLAIVLILLGLLGHHLHHPVLPDPPTPAPVAVHVADSAPDAAGSALRIMDHGALVEIDVEVCVPGGQGPHMAATGPGDVAVPSPDVRGDIVYPALSVVPAWSVPALAPDVFRAFLQVFLN